MTDRAASGTGARAAPPSRYARAVVTAGVPSPARVWYATRNVATPEVATIALPIAVCALAWWSTSAGAQARMVPSGAFVLAAIA